MFNKYKIKRRRKAISLYMILIVIFVGILILSVGYSIWSDSLSITGKANIKIEQTSEDVGDLDIAIDKIGDRYTQGNDPAGLTLVSDEFANGCITTTYKDSSNNNYTIYGIYRFYFTNSGNVTYTNGTVSCEVTGSTAAIGNWTPTVTASIAPNVTGEFSAYLPVNTALIEVETRIKYTISYNVGTEVKKMYFVIVILPEG